MSATITDTRPRTVSYINNLDGQIMLRSEQDNIQSTGDPKESHFYFNNQGLGVVSRLRSVGATPRQANNGAGTDVDYTGGIAVNTAAYGTKPFANGTSTRARSLQMPMPATRR